MRKYASRAQVRYLGGMKTWTAQGAMALVLTFGLLNALQAKEACGSHAAESGGRGHASDGAEADGRGYLQHQPQQLEGCSGTFQWGCTAEMVSAEGLS